MHIENMHAMIEKLTECTKSALESDKTHIGQYPIGEVVDMIKDLSEAEYYSKISKAMEKADEEEEKQDEYALMRLKEDYGEDDGQRYYNEWRYASGRYAPKGRGTRRGYDAPIRYHMPPEMYYIYPSEYYRDMDRWDNDKMYYAGRGANSNSGNMSGNRSGNSDSSSRSYSDGYNDGNSRGYEDGNRQGYNEGNRRGYEEGYSRGRSEGQRMTQRDTREGRSGQSRRGYMETKEAHPENTPEAKQTKMRELEKYMNELSSDITEMIAGASPEEKTVLRNKMQTLQQKIV